LSDVGDEVDEHNRHHPYRSHIHTQDSSEDIDAVKETGRLLATDITNYMH